jgi:hypothetical protein
MAKKEFMQRFDFKDCEDLEKYVGCKIERTANYLKLTQPVLVTVTRLNCLQESTGHLHRRGLS